MTNHNTHLEASRYIQSIFTLTEIHKRWNKSGLGKPAVIKTVKRWLNNGPKTKNPRFEGWLREWADQEWTNRERSVTIEDVKDTVVLLCQQLQALEAAA